MGSGRPCYWQSNLINGTGQQCQIADGLKAISGTKQKLALVIRHCQPARKYDPLFLKTQELLTAVYAFFSRIKAYLSLYAYYLRRAKEL